MLKNVLDRLIVEGNWEFFLRFFDSKIEDILSDMKQGQIKTLEELSKVNGQLEVYELLKDLPKIVKE